MKFLTQHIVPGDAMNHQLHIAVLDMPGHGGSSHEYLITHDEKRFARVAFQNGPIKEHGVNGITHEALLAILIDRLEGFQSGPFASAHNASALGHLRGALYGLQARTRERIERGVEGTHEK